MLNLPEQYDRVIYGKSPLSEVICQVRFPAILRIASQEPADFQERVRREYPIFRKTSTRVQQEFGEALKKLGVPTPGVPQSYEFLTEDNLWKVVLVNDFISLSTVAYSRFEEFQERAAFILSTFEDVYQPNFFQRIGLRYKNWIIRSELDLGSQSWETLISEEIASELHSSTIKDAIEYYDKRLNLSLENDRYLNFQHGIQELEAPDGRREKCYILDFDFYSNTKRGSSNEVLSNVSRLNQDAGKIFRWSISESLHKQMEPEPVQ